MLHLVSRCWANGWLFSARWLSTAGLLSARGAFTIGLLSITGRLIATGRLLTTRWRATARRTSAAKGAILGRLQNLLEVLHGEAELLCRDGQVWGTLLWITQGIAQRFLRDSQRLGRGSQVERRPAGWMFTIGRLSVARRLPVAGGLFSSRGLAAGWRWFAG